MHPRRARLSDRDLPCEERVEPREVAAAITETFGRYDVRELICEPGDWTWVMLAMEFERLPIVKEPRSP